MRQMAFDHMRLRSSIQSISKSRITQNVFALYAIQIATYVVPLAVVPYLARVLGPYSWGIVALAQALGLYLFLVVDFGFQLSATRKVARLHDDPKGLERTLAGVMGAKIVLALGCLGATLAAQFCIPSFRQNYAILWMGILWGIGQGFSPLWLYQGLERMKTSSFVDIVAKTAGAGGVFLFVHNAGDAWKVLGLQCLCNCGGTIVLLWMAYREISFRWPTRRDISEALRESASMFLFRSAVSLYTVANTLILGAVATPLAVGFYSGAERISRAVTNLINPISQSIFPRLSRLVVEEQGKAIRLARLSLVVMAVFGLSLGAALFIGAPIIVRILLGRGYESVVPVLRVLSLLVPSVSLSNVLGIQWMLPLRMDRELNRIIIAAGVINLALALWWASRWQQIGMAWAVSVAEFIILALTVITLLRSRLSPVFTDDDLVFRLKQRANACLKSRT